MHSDLLMLRVACRVVEAAPSHAPPTPDSAIPKTNNNSTTNNNTSNMLPRLVLPAISVSTATSAAPWDARRIGPLPALHRAVAPDTAGLVLGLKRPAPDDDETEDEQDETNNNDPQVQIQQNQQHQHYKRQRVVAPPPPGVFMDSPLAKLVRGPTRSPLGVESWATTALPTPTTTANANATLDTDDTSEPATPSPTTEPVWRSPPPRGRPPTAASLPSLVTATSPPTLVRTSSAPWRQNMPALDRTRTRERILRGFDRQCRGDYDALLAIVTALDEELLHVHTTSKDHYFTQTIALRDRIATLAPPRTTLPRPHL